MNRPPRSFGHGHPMEVPLPDEDDDVEPEDELTFEDLSFCELCGATEEDYGEELLRCEECGRLHCSDCRMYDDEETPLCSECGEEYVEE